jgi:hypothetical protein
MWLQKGFSLVSGFIGLFDTARDYTLQFAITQTQSRLQQLTMTELQQSSNSLTQSLTSQPTNSTQLTDPQ